MASRRSSNPVSPEELVYQMLGWSLPKEKLQEQEYLLDIVNFIHQSAYQTFHEWRSNNTSQFAICCCYQKEELWQAKDAPGRSLFWWTEKEGNPSHGKSLLHSCFLQKLTLSVKHLQDFAILATENIRASYLVEEIFWEPQDGGKFIEGENARELIPRTTILKISSFFSPERGSY